MDEKNYGFDAESVREEFKEKFNWKNDTEVDEMSVVLLNKGDKVTVTFDKNAKGEYIKANSIKK